MASSAPSPQNAGPSPLDASGMLRPALLARIHAIEIRTRRLTASLVGGEYRSIFRGAGIEFAEAREYIDGDDVRFIDWNVTARMGTPWVKQFVEERDLTVVCAVDRSASALVGRPLSGRLGAAGELTALLSFAATQSNDRAALLLFSAGVDAFVPAARTTRHALRMVRDVLMATPAVGQRTNIGAAADYLAQVLGRRALIFFISDFLDTGYQESLRGLSGRHEVIALALNDPIDLALPDLGLVAVVDAESGERLWLDTSDARVRANYATLALERAERRHRSLAQSGVEEIAIDIEGDAVAPVAAYFRRRVRGQ